MSKDFAIATNFNYFHLMYFVAIVSIKMKRIQFIQLTTLENSCLHEKKNSARSYYAKFKNFTSSHPEWDYRDFLEHTPEVCLKSASQVDWDVCLPKAKQF